MGRPNIPPDTRAMMAKGQAAFRQKLAQEANESALRLEEAYKRTLRQIAKRLADFKAIAGEQGMTTAQLAQEAATVRLKEAVESALADLSKQIEREAKRLQNSGALAGTQTATADMIRLVGGGFNRPSIEQIQALIGYVDSDAFQNTLGQYPVYHAGYVGDMILSGASQGKNPLTVAAEIAKYLNNFPYADAVRMTRTVQLWSARRGTQQIFKANSDVVSGWIWSSARDTRTCPSCWAMDGKKFSNDEILNGHYLCRCAMVPITSTWASLGLENAPEVSDSYGTGADAFQQLSEAEQKQILGPAKFAAWSDGAFEFDQLAKIFMSDVYGPMRGEATLEELVGAQLAALYKRRAA